MKRADYRRPIYLVKGQVTMRFDLDANQTRVETRYTMYRAESASREAPLVLNVGAEVEILVFRVNGIDAVYARENEGTLTINEVPDGDFEIFVVTLISPEKNTTLEGLYTAGPMLLTQNEAEGFRHITAYPDHPDMLATFQVTLVADKTRYPVLLSNGNNIGNRDLGDGRHESVWDNPFLMPCYLFAIVAGDLAFLRGSHTTPSGHMVATAVIADKTDVESGKCDHALASLHKAMEFDERVYGRECDVDTFMIVATSHFNFGAMENKGLNIFNSKYVFATPDTATDVDYERIEGVVAHEYFHNWTGNRITCQNWLELGLKEGLTVFRDESFSLERWGLRKLIQIASDMRVAQFAEDASPRAHPVRPEEIKAVNNMYTMTVYEKGAEVYRMLYILLGEKGWRKGTDLYFERHDGQAVAIDDLIKCMEDANGVDLTQFKNWFVYAGTPIVEIAGKYDSRAHTYTMTVKQSCPATPGQQDKPSFVIPLVVGFIGRRGELRVRSLSPSYDSATGVLLITKQEEVFVFRGVTTKPALSLNRAAAPVKVKYDYRKGELATLMASGTSLFSRWDAGQTYALQVACVLVDDVRAGKDLALPEDFVSAFGRILSDKTMDKNLLAAMISLPGQAEVSNLCEEVDPDAVYAAVKFVRRALAGKFRKEFADLYETHKTDNRLPLSFEPKDVANRAVANDSLGYLTNAGVPGEVASIIWEQFVHSAGMTDKYRALSLLANRSDDGDYAPLAERALAAFYEQFEDNGNVVDKWLVAQSTSRAATAAKMEALMEHPGFDIGIPNRIRSVVGGFVSNSVRFHDLSGDGYAFLTKFIRGHAEKNDTLTSRLVQPLTDFRRYEPKRRVMMERELRELYAALKQMPQEKVKTTLERIEQGLAG